MSMRRVEFDIEKAKRLYDEGTSLENVGRVLGVNRSTIKRRFSEYGLPMRSPKDVLRVRTQTRLPGEKNPNWKGGRISAQGYILLKKRGHPNANKQGYVFEHTFIMSEKLGRPLLPCENVHHKNGIRDDNDPDNLELWIVMQPSGQRVSDKLEWARKFIDQYDGIAA